MGSDCRATRRHTPMREDLILGGVLRTEEAGIGALHIAFDGRTGR